ncbi:hypothetical protein Tco_0206237 [Tanacetum coccineum]
MWLVISRIYKVSWFLLHGFKSAAAEIQEKELLQNNQFGNVRWICTRMAMAALSHIYIAGDLESEKKQGSSKPVSFGYQRPMLMESLRVGSIEPLENPLDTKKLESSSYHALGACLRPYNALIC